MSPAASTSSIRSALDEMVEYEEDHIGSRMLAYDAVASAIGMSSSWVRKFLANSEEVKEPRMTLFHNIRVNYEKFCNRVEQENRNDERRLRLIKGEIDAVTQGFMEETGCQDQAGNGGEAR